MSPKIQRAYHTYCAVRNAPSPEQDVLTDITRFAETVYLNELSQFDSFIYTVAAKPT